VRRAAVIAAPLVMGAATAFLSCGDTASRASSASTGGAAGQGAGRAGTSGASGRTTGGRAGAAGKSGGGGTAGKPSSPVKLEVQGGDCPAVTGFGPNVDDTWIQYSGFGCDHALVIPGPTTPSREPFSWGPCPASAGSVGDCQQLLGRAGGLVATGQFVFAKSGAGAAILGVLRYSVDPSGTIVEGEISIGEADGPILQSMVPAGQVFWTNLEWFDATSYAFTMSGTDSDEHGIIAGRFGEPLPTYVRRLPNVKGGTSSWAVSGSLVVRNLTTINASPWLPEDGPLAYGKDPDGLPGYVRHLLDDRVFIQVNANGLSGMMTWTAADGLKPVVRYYGDFEKSAMRWSTDGHDMIWIEGVGPPSEPYHHPQMNVMTAPYSVDAQAIQKGKRSLGPDPIQSSPQPLPVGCGYAATAWVNDTQTANGLAIVRLSDATWWKLKPTVVPYAARPLGITCEHAYYEFANQVLRIRLDSLPPGGLP
jgi:hypothetical protein